MFQTNVSVIKAETGNNRGGGEFIFECYYIFYFFS